MSPNEAKQDAAMDLGLWLGDLIVDLMHPEPHPQHRNVAIVLRNCTKEKLTLVTSDFQAGGRWWEQRKPPENINPRSMAGWVAEALPPGDWVWGGDLVQGFIEYKIGDEVHIFMDFRNKAHETVNDYKVRLENDPGQLYSVAWDGSPEMASRVDILLGMSAMDL